jgi:phytoene dehydrogenase-like protein
MPEKSVIIIGAGIAGLSAGCYAQMNGFRSQIFELHSLPGGLCTAWERKDYVFDGCIHYLLGSGEGQPYNQVWQELGAVRERQMIDHSEFMRLKGTDGRTLIIYSDPDQLEEHMLSLSPQDERLIRSLVQAIRQFKGFDMSLLQQKPRSLMNLGDWMALGMKMLPFLQPTIRWGLVSAADLGKRFKDPLLQRAFPHVFGWPEIPMMAGISLLASMKSGNAGFPAGASLEFARAIEQRYLGLGGEIHYNAQVEKILVKDGHAVGVRLYNDDVHHADYVISAADGRGTIFDMLDGDFTNRKLQGMYDGHLTLHSQVQISLGVNRDLSAEPHWVTYLLDEPILLAGEEHFEIGIKHYCFDPSLAPEGKSSLIMMLRSKYAYWQRIYGRKLNDTEQDQVSDILIDFLEKLYPGIHQDIEVIDEATPLSYERYTGNWEGSSCGWLLTKQTMPMMIVGINKTLPGLQNFYMTGQWVEPGGMVPIVAMSGRNVIQLLCHAEGQPFETSRA